MENSFSRAEGLSPWSPCRVLPMSATVHFHPGLRSFGASSALDVCTRIVVSVCPCTCMRAHTGTRPYLPKPEDNPGPPSSGGVSTLRQGLIGLQPPMRQARDTLLSPPHSTGTASVLFCAWCLHLGSRV